MVDFSLKPFPGPRHENFSKFSPAPTRFSGNNFEILYYRDRWVVRSKFQ